ncbi:PadR family transcriptional regulator [Erysipelotrichaceae bacterium]|nr:PadR family transcriptional regulator [Erysipelotrichaceae bacterium]
MDTQLKKGTLEFCVIALLSHRDWYGYELTQELNKLLIVKDATIYLILQRLEKANFVEAYIQVMDDSAKIRKYHHLTAKGIERLSLLQEEWARLAIIVEQCIEKGEMSK